MSDENKIQKSPTQPQDVRPRPDAGRGNPKITDPKLPDLDDDPADTPRKIEPQGGERNEGGRNPSLERKGNDPSRTGDEQRVGGSPKGDTARTGGRQDDRSQSSGQPGGQPSGSPKQAPKSDFGGAGKKSDMSAGRESDRR